MRVNPRRAFGKQLLQPRKFGPTSDQVMPPRRSCRASSTICTSVSADNPAASVPHLLIAAIVDKVGSKNALAVTDECIRAVPLVHAKVFVEAVRDGVPRHLPLHPCLDALDVRLRRTRNKRERRVAGVQMREVCNLVSHEGTAAA